MPVVTAYDTSVPADTDNPASGNDVMQDIKKAIQERQNVDHYWPVTGTVLDATSDCGKHRQITFKSVITTPTPASGQTIFYSKTVGSGVELAAITNGSAELVLTTEDCTALAVNVDDSSIEQASGVVQIKAGGVTAAMLAAGSVDDSTLEIDTTLKIKTPAVPSAGGDAYPEEIHALVEATGKYTGTGAEQTIKCGFKVRHLSILPTVGYPVVYIVTDSGSVGHLMGGAVNTAVTFTADGFTVSSSATVNSSGEVFHFVATGERV